MTRTTRARQGGSRTQEENVALPEHEHARTTRSNAHKVDDEADAKHKVGSGRNGNGHAGQGGQSQPEKRASIFERFYQAHADDHRSGLGLGLYIIQQIVAKHDGTITAEFPTDGGIRFVVRLPAHAPVPETAAVS